jgi:HlyD family secretion protein
MNKKMNVIPPAPDAPIGLSGAAMDVPLPPRKRRWPVIAGAAGALACVLGYLVWNWMPHGLVVAESAVTLATVERGVFRDDITLRATARALNSIVIDSVDRGRVETVYVRDGAMVNKDQLLFRLSNPQRRMELLQRQSEQAQQTSNLESFNISSSAARSDSLRRVKELEFNVREAEKQHDRNAKLAAQGFISQSVLRDSADKLANVRRALADEERIAVQEETTRRNAIRTLEGAITNMRLGMNLFNASIDALTVRAPVAGRLTDFNLQVGEAVKEDQRIGRIDEPDSFKLNAQVDEFYLPRIAVGHQGKASYGGKTYPVEVKTILAQVKDGRFTVDMVFSGATPSGMKPGQSVDLSITLGEPAPALLLPNGPFVNDSGGAWVYVVEPGGKNAERRPIRLGRRNNSQVEVISGLAAGERAVVSSYAGLGKAERLHFSR